MGQARGIASVAAGLALLCGGTAGARDYGQQGAVFQVQEEDFLKVVEARLHALQKSGALTALNRRMSETVKAQVLDPPPVRGVSAAQGPRTWLFDPSIVLQEDIRDEENRVIAARGTRINPLDHVSLRQKLVFLDGKDEAQVRWALTSASSERVRLILTSGSAFRLMERHQRRFYFDQGGALTARFGINHVPAVVEQEGRLLRIRELAINPAAEGRR